MDSRIQVIKIGSACVFGSSGLNYDVMRKRARDMQEMDFEDLKYGMKPILVVSGAIALGKLECNETRPNKDIDFIELQRYSCIGQPLLVQFYAHAFEGIYTVSQLLVTTKEIADEESVRERIKDDAGHGIVTLINYNDGVDFEELRQDNDTLAATVAKYISAKRLVNLGKYDGMLDSNGRVIEKVSSVDKGMYKMCNGVSNNGTGGFEAKLDAAKMLMEAGIEMIISNVNYDVRDVVAGRVPRTLFSKI